MDADLAELRTEHPQLVAAVVAAVTPYVDVGGDEVAEADPLDAGADLRHPAGELVPRDERQVRDREVAAEDVHVRAADAADVRP